MERHGLVRYTRGVWARYLREGPCNNRLMHIETGFGPGLPEWQRPALAAHLMKCPECPEQPG